MGLERIGCKPSDGDYTRLKPLICRFEKDRNKGKRREQGDKTARSPRGGEGPKIHDFVGVVPYKAPERLSKRYPTYTRLD